MSRASSKRCSLTRKFTRNCAGAVPTMSLSATSRSCGGRYARPRRCLTWPAHTRRNRCRMLERPGLSIGSRGANRFPYSHNSWRSPGSLGSFGLQRVRQERHQMRSVDMVVVFAEEFGAALHHLNQVFRRRQRTLTRFNLAPHMRRTISAYGSRVSSAMHFLAVLLCSTCRTW